MNRRRVLVSSFALLANGHWPNSTFAQGSPEPMIVALPDLPSGISPVPLTDEVDLLYFRAIPDAYGVRFFGELQNNADYWVASPPLVLVSRSGLRAQPRMLHSDIPPQGREQFSGGFGELAEKDKAEAREMTIDTVETELCDFGPGAFGTYNDQMNLRVVIEKETVDLDRGALRASITVTNLGEFRTELVTVAALVFDEDRYYCGDISSLGGERLKSGESFTYELERGFETFSTAGSPLDLVNDKPVIVYQAGWIPNVSLSCV